MCKRFPVPAALLAACWLSLAALPALADPPQAKLQTRCYHVADLVVPLAQGSSVPACEEPQTLEERLSDLIVRTINPDSWSDRGGSGTIDYFPLTMSLVINQTADVQEQVQELLTTLRRQQDVEVALEVRVVNISTDFVEQIGVNFDRDTTQKDQLGMKFLDDKQVRMLMEAAQGDSRTNVMQAPKITLLDGQAGTFNVTEAQPFVTGVEKVRSRGLVTFSPKVETITTGFRMTAQPVVSADRRFVQVSLKIDQTDLASPVPLMPVKLPVESTKGGEPIMFTQYIQQPKVTTMAVETTVTIPDGGTVVFGGLKKLSETRQECGPPILSKVPYANRLFKNVAYGKEEQSVLFMVTPRIIINEQEEAKAAPAAPACRENRRWGGMGCMGGCPFKEARACPMQARSKCAEPSCSAGLVLPSPRYLMHPPQYCTATPTIAAPPAPPESVPAKEDLAAKPHARIVTKAPKACGVGQVEDAKKLLLMVSPRIIINEQEEAKAAAAAPACRVNEACGNAYTWYGGCVVKSAEPVVEKQNTPTKEEPAAKPHARIVAKLLKAYDRACDEGQTEEAKKLAKALLSIDPTCFHGKR